MSIIHAPSLTDPIIHKGGTATLIMGFQRTNPTTGFTETLDVSTVTAVTTTLYGPTQTLTNLTYTVDATANRLRISDNRFATLDYGEYQLDITLTTPNFTQAFSVSPALIVAKHEASRGSVIDLGIIPDLDARVSELSEIVKRLTAWKGLVFKAADPNVASTVAAEPSYNLKYSADFGRTWKALNATPVPVDKYGIYVKGSGFTNPFSTSPVNGFTMTGKIAASGSIMSLLDGVGESTTISSADQFANMFMDCHSLVQAPEFPATTLSYRCYRNLFRNSSITQAPALPATNITVDCYKWAFAYCSQLTQAPVLPATTIQNGCYAYMFYGCALRYLEVHATSWSAASPSDRWLDANPVNGTFKCPASLNIPSGVSGIPTGWTRVDL